MVHGNESAINKNTIKVTFNTNAEELKLADVKVALAGVDLYVEKVEVTGNVATITTGDNLTADKTYAVTVKDAEPVEVKYTVAEAAKVELTTTTISNSTTKLVSKVTDKDGNDITVDYAVKYESSKTANIDADGNVTVASFPTAGVIVKPYVIVGSEKVYGEQVTIKLEAGKATTYAGFTIVDDADGDGTVSAAKFADIEADDVKTSIKIGESANDKWYIAPYVLNQFDEKFSNDSTAYTYESLDPTKLVVNASTGEITPIATGTARVKITNGSFAKVITIDVLAKAKLETIEVSESAVALSDQSPAKTVVVKTKDQYGDDFVLTGLTADVKDTNGVISVNSSSLTTDGKIVVTPVSGKEGTATITVKNGEVSETFTVTVSKAGSTIAGYKAVLTTDSESKDLTIDKADTDDDTLKLELYGTDAKGNIISSTPVDATWKVKDYSDGFVTISDDAPTADGITDTAVSNVTVTAVKAGTVTLIPVVDGLELTPVTITVVDTTVGLKSVAVVRNTISVNQDTTDANVFAAVLANLTATGTDSKAYTLTNADIEAIHTSSTSVFTDIDLDDEEITIGEAGTATLTVVFKDDVAPLSFKVNVVDNVKPLKLVSGKLTVNDGGITGTAEAAEAGATIKVYTSGSTTDLKATATVKADGSFDKITLAAAIYDVYVVDAAGNISDKLEVTVTAAS